MRQTILLTMLAVGVLAALPTASKAQYAHCVSGYGCVPATQESYNACFQLALRRGLTVTVGDHRNLNMFIYECLSGKIRR
jgi:hypothetical protein